MQGTTSQGRTPRRATERFNRHVCVAVIGGALLLPADLVAQLSRSSGPNARHPGSAVVMFGEHEFTIRIECRVPSQPERGFTTEPNRVTRRETGGRYNMVTLRLRPWQDTNDVIVNLDGDVVWMPTPTSTGGVLSTELDMSASKIVRDNLPVLLTYEMWQNGERPPGRSGVRFVADCNERDPEAPSYRKLGGGG